MVKLTTKIVKSTDLWSKISMYKIVDFKSMINNFQFRGSIMLMEESSSEFCLMLSKLEGFTFKIFVDFEAN
jgi:hypothetical protein